MELVRGRSVHTAACPEAGDLAGGDASALSAASSALIGIRRAKTEAKAPQKTPMSRAVIAAPANTLEALCAAAGDLSAVGRIAELVIVEGDELAVIEIELAPAEEN